MLKAKVKRYVFKLDLKLARVVEDLMWGRRGFQRFGPATENALSPFVLRRVPGTDRSCKCIHYLFIIYTLYHGKPIRDME